MRVLRAIMEQL